MSAGSNLKRRRNMSKKDTSYWYQRTIDQLLITGRSQRTAETYAREIRILGRWLDKPLDEVDEEDLRSFILYRRNECKLGGSSMRILYSGLKTLYSEVMQNKWPLLEVMKSQRETKLPIILSREEVQLIFSSISRPQNMTYLRLVYSCGLRLSEALNLKPSDIYYKSRGCIHIHGKGSKDRYVPLPNKTYRYIRRYWSLHQNTEWIFPALGTSGQNGPKATRPMATSTVQAALHRAVKKAGIQKAGIRVHTLRHCYATHLLDAGISIKVVQELLGHGSLQQTLVYLHLTNWGKANTHAKIDQLMKDL